MGGWNFCAYIIGPPEYGKTTIAKALVQRHLADPDGVVFVHDPVAQFSEQGCAYYANADAWRDAARAAAAAEPPTPLPRGSSLGGDAEQVTALAMELGRKVGNRENAVRRKFLVVYDEASLRTDSGATYMGKMDNEVLATRRHLGVGLVNNLQDPTQLMSRWLRMGTDFYLFVQTSRYAAVLDEALYLEKGTLEKAGVTRLGQYQYLHVRMRVGVVGEAL